MDQELSPKSEQNLDLLRGMNKDSEIANNQVIDKHSNKTPKSTLGLIFHYTWFPLEYVINHFKAGSLKGAVFTLIMAILWSGTVSLPYLASRNGIILASLYIIFGASTTYFCSMLLISWAEKLGKDKYEDFAKHWYGKKMEIFTGVSNFVTLIGFAITYLVYIKTLIPHILEITMGAENVPSMLGEVQFKGELVWASIYVFFILIPMSLPRKINTLRFSSLIGVICTAYFILWIMLLFFFDRKLVPNIENNFVNASYFNFTVGGMIHAIPYINFNYLYQPNVPIIYRELHHKSYSNMQKVILYSSLSVVIMYVLVGSFGYLGLVGHYRGLSVLNSKNDILEVEYDSIAFDIGIVALLLTVIAVTPLVILPAKDTVEDLFFGEDGMNETQNIIITVILWMITLVTAVAFPGIDDAITIWGFTTFPLIGFILPWVFYLKMIDNIPTYKFILWWIMIIYISITSIVIFVLFLYEKISGIRPY